MTGVVHPENQGSRLFFLQRRNQFYRYYFSLPRCLTFMFKSWTNCGWYVATGINTIGINRNRPCPNYALGQGLTEGVRRTVRLQEAYFSSTSAPASTSCFLRFSASSLGKPSLIVLGAPSTTSLASFKPRPVSSLTSFTI